MVMLVPAGRAHQRARADRPRPQRGVQEGAAALRARGFTKARIDGQFRSLEDDIRLDRRRNHTIDVVVDRLIVRSGIERRLAESIEIALDARRRHRHHQHARRRRSAVLAAAGVRRLRRQRAGDDAARLLVQLAARRLPDVPGPRARRTTSIRSASCRTNRSRCSTAPSRRGRAAIASSCGRRCTRSRRRSASTSTCPLRSCRSKHATCCLYGPGRGAVGGGCGARDQSAARAAGPRSIRARLRGRAFRTCAAGTRKAPGPNRRSSSRYRALRAVPRLRRGSA